jgi:aspartyl-tRNA(Asn)/glutamyl-tRNA(Gln) amidotransferase subunit A
VGEFADLRQRHRRGVVDRREVNLHQLSAAELSSLYAAGSASPLEVARAVIAHIERWEPHLHATYAFDPEGALAMARESEARWQRGEPRGALDGVPTLLKENIATQGVPMPVGTAATELVPMAEDAPAAARLREAGAVFLGKSTMPDYGMLSSGLSSFHPLARNPWDLSKNPGGSSAGAGAAAAAGYGPLHVGTDIGGSVRLPAGWCGIFGLKPSLGRIPIKPPYPGRVAGPMTRTVRDAALLMSVLSQPDWRDSMSLPWQDIAWGQLQRDLKGVRVGLQLDAGWGLAVQPETAAAVEAAAAAFAAAGAIVEPMSAFMTREMIDGLDRFWRMRSWLDISALPAARRAKVLPYILDWVESGASLTAAQVFHGYSQMGVMRDAAVVACQPYDFTLSPTSPVASFAAEWAGPTNDPHRPFEHIAFTLPFNMSEQPSASINCGYTSTGLPIGLQITGRRHDDLGVLQMAFAYEQLRSGQRDWPLPPH